MKKFLSFLAFSFLLTTSISAQKMSDDQVVEYVKTATAAGKPQKQIMTEVAAKGVTRAQAERIKKRYEEALFGIKVVVILLELKIIMTLL